MFPLIELPSVSKMKQLLRWEKNHQFAINYQMNKSIRKTTTTPTKSPIRIVEPNRIDDGSCLVTCIYAWICSVLFFSHSLSNCAYVISIRTSNAVCHRFVCVLWHCVLKVKGNIGDQWCIHSYRSLRYIHSSTNHGFIVVNGFYFVK